MNIQLTKSMVLGLAAWAVTSVMTQVGPADAASRRVSALACTDLSRAYYDDGAVMYGADEDYDPETVEVTCGVPSDTTLTHANTVTLHVYGTEPSGSSNWSRACVQDNDAQEAACGPTKNWGSGTRGVRNVDVSEWQAEPSHYPFVVTKLDATGGIAGLFGIYMSN